jgi:nucleotide-binding universal stress UspA family protein
MTRVLAALDNSAAAQPVLSTAVAVARLFEAEVEPVHVRTDGEVVARSVAEKAGLALTELEGGTVEQLLGVASREDVVLVVLGARGTAGGRRPAGHTALAVAKGLDKPVILVPPDAPHPGRLRRVLVPLEGTLSTSLAPRGVIELASRASLDVIVLHVLEEHSLPAFTDQPQHEADAWAREFLERYCPSGVDRVQFELRVGLREELVPRVAEETDADLIALGWSGALTPDRAPVVQAALERGHRPVLLIPVDRSGERRESFTRLQSSPA